MLGIVVLALGRYLLYLGTWNLGGCFKLVQPKQFKLQPFNSKNSDFQDNGCSLLHCQIRWIYTQTLGLNSHSEAELAKRFMYHEEGRPLYLVKPETCCGGCCASGPT